MSLDNTTTVELMDEEVTLLLEALDVQIESAVAARKQLDPEDDQGEGHEVVMINEQIQDWEALKVKLQGAK